MVSGRLTERATLLRFHELQQSLSVVLVGGYSLPPGEVLDAFNRLRQKCSAPISPQPPRFGRRRIRPGRRRCSFALLFAIIESAMVFFAGQVLETGVQDSGRLLYTSQNVSQVQFKQDFCNRVGALFPCDSLDLCLDVRRYARRAR